MTTEITAETFGLLLKEERSALCCEEDTHIVRQAREEYSRCLIAVVDHFERIYGMRNPRNWSNTVGPFTDMLEPYQQRLALIEQAAEEQRGRAWGRASRRLESLLESAAAQAAAV